MVVVENRTQLEKIDQVRESLPDLKAVVVYKDTVPEGNSAYSVSLDQFLLVFCPDFFRCRMFETLSACLT